MSTLNASEAPALPRRTRWLAYVVGAFGLGIGNAMTFLIPLRARELGAGFDVIGVLVAAAAIVPALVSVPLGAVIDRSGPKRSFVVGAALCGVVALSAAAAPNYWVLLVIQLVFGATRGLGWIGSQSYITGLGRLRDRASLTGRFSFFSNVGVMVAPVITGLVAQAGGYQVAFLFIAGYGFAFAALGLLLEQVPSAGTGGTSGTGFGAAAKLMKIRGMQVALMLTGVRLWSAKIWSGFFPVYLVDVGIEPAVAGSVLSASGLVATLLAPTAGGLTRFARPSTVAAAGLGVGAVGLMLAPRLASMPIVYLAPIFAGVASGLSLPLLLTIVTNAVSDDERGLALGLRQTVNNIAGSGAPLVIGPLVSAMGITLGFLTGGGLAGAALIGAVMLSWSSRPSAATVSR